MTDLEEEGEEWQNQNPELDMTQFYRVVGALGNYVRRQSDPVAALDEIAASYRPKTVKQEEWITRTYDVLIQSWINYSPEIQSALKDPVPATERMNMAYRDAIAYIVSHGEFNKK